MCFYKCHPDKFTDDYLLTYSFDSPQGWYLTVSHQFSLLDVTGDCHTCYG